MSRTCPKCGIYAPRDIAICPCGRKLPKQPVPDRFRAWFPFLLLLIFPIVYLLWEQSERRPLSEVATAPIQQQKPASCIEISGLALDDSNPASDGAVALRGTALNTCTETLNDIVLRLTIHDDKGVTHAAGVEIYELKPGIAQPFKRAWVGQITAWEVTANK